MKYAEGDLGPRIYVIEVESAEISAQRPGILATAWVLFNIYEEIAFDYWNDTVEPASVNTAESTSSVSKRSPNLLNRTLLEPKLKAAAEL